MTSLFQQNPYVYITKRPWTTSWKGSPPKEKKNPRSLFHLVPIYSVSVSPTRRSFISWRRERGLSFYLCIREQKWVGQQQQRERRRERPSSLIALSRWRIRSWISPLSRSSSRRGSRLVERPVLLVTLLPLLVRRTRSPLPPTATSLSGTCSSIFIYVRCLNPFSFSFFCA